MNYMCEIIEDEKKSYQNRSSICSFDQFAYKHIYYIIHTWTVVLTKQLYDFL
jgi:hypothetical protein